MVNYTLPTNRENNLIEGLNFFIKSCSEKRKDEIIIIVSDIGVRLYQKLVSDGIIKTEIFTSIEEASIEYKKLKAENIDVEIKFITPIISEYGGEEEQYNIREFYKNIGLDIENEDLIKKEMNRSQTDVIYLADTPLDLPCELQVNFHIFCVNEIYQNAVSMVDLYRYIVGVYKIENRRIVVYPKDVYGLTQFPNIIFEVFRQASEILMKRCIEALDFGVEVYGLRDVFSAKEIYISIRSKEEQSELDSLVNYGYILKKDNKYYANYLTFVSLIALFSNTNFEAYDDFYRRMQFFWRDDKEVLRTGLLLNEETFYTFYNGIMTYEEYTRLMDSWVEAVIKMRNNPSIFSSVASALRFFEEDYIVMDRIIKEYYEGIGETRKRELSEKPNI